MSRMRWLLAGFCLMMVAGCDPACENEVSQELLSPDGRHRAVVFSRTCGATTGPDTQATILRKGERLPDQPGNAFIIDEDEANVSWKSDGGLLVSFGPEARIIKKEPSAGGVKIEYRP